MGQYSLFSTKFFFTSEKRDSGKTDISEKKVFFFLNMNQESPSVAYYLQLICRTTSHRVLYLIEAVLCQHPTL